MRILIFGDSIVHGTWDSAGGWADRIKQQYHRRYIDSGGTEKVQVYNLGIGGEDSGRLRTRIENEIKARYDKRWPSSIIVATGKNDSRLLDGTTPQTSEEQFKTNLSEIFDICKRYTNKVLYISPAGLSGEETINFKGNFYSNERLYTYVDAARQAAEQQNIPMLDIFRAIEGNPELFGPDGVHPNTKGYELLAGLIQPEVEKLLK